MPNDENQSVRDMLAQRSTEKAMANLDCEDARPRELELVLR
jgi:hypothetical protein